MFLAPSLPWRECAKNGRNLGSFPSGNVTWCIGDIMSRCAPVRKNRITREVIMSNSNPLRSVSYCLSAALLLTVATSGVTFAAPPDKGLPSEGWTRAFGAL